MLLTKLSIKKGEFTQIFTFATSSSAYTNPSASPRKPPPTSRTSRTRVDRQANVLRVAAHLYRERRLGGEFHAEGPTIRRPVDLSAAFCFARQTILSPKNRAIGSKSLSSCRRAWPWAMQKAPMIRSIVFLNVTPRSRNRRLPRAASIASASLDIATIRKRRSCRESRAAWGSSRAPCRIYNSTRSPTKISSSSTIISSRPTASDRKPRSWAIHTDASTTIIFRDRTRDPRASRRGLPPTPCPSTPPGLSSGHAGERARATPPRRWPSSW